MPTCAAGRQAQAAPLGALTQRERDVPIIVAAGKSSKYIAECCSLRVKVVGKHRTDLLAKFNLHNAAGLAAYAIESGLLF